MYPTTDKTVGSRLLEMETFHESIFFPFFFSQVVQPGLCFWFEAFARSYFKLPTRESFVPL